MNVRFSILLVFLLTILLVLPLAAQSPQGAILLRLSYSAMLVAAVVALERGGWVRSVALALAIPSIGSDLLESAGATALPRLAELVLDGSFVIFVSGAILRYVVRRDEVTSQIVLGGICVYLLLGIFFAQVYAGLEFVAPGALLEAGNVFTGSAHPLEEFGKLTYFSFVTLTTLGYGDISPALPLPRAVATLEAVIGQIYLAVFIGTLVGQRVASSGGLQAQTR